MDSTPWPGPEDQEGVGREFVAFIDEHLAGVPPNEEGDTTRTFRIFADDIGRVALFTIGRSRTAEAVTYRITTQPPAIPLMARVFRWTIEYDGTTFCAPELPARPYDAGAIDLVFNAISLIEYFNEAQQHGYVELT